MGCQPDDDRSMIESRRCSAASRAVGDASAARTRVGAPLPSQSRKPQSSGPRCRRLELIISTAAAGNAELSDVRIPPMPHMIDRRYLPAAPSRRLAFRPKTLPAATNGIRNGPPRSIDAVHVRSGGDAVSDPLPPGRRLGSNIWKPRRIRLVRPLAEFLDRRVTQFLQSGDSITQ